MHPSHPIWRILSNTQQHSILTPTATNRQRFLEEPKDTLALLGQHADLVCLVENKRGHIFWKRDETGLGINQIDPVYHRYSIPPNSAQTTWSVEADNGGQDDHQSTSSVSNITLHIQEVALKDDAVYQCIVNGHDSQYRKILSRKAKLTVLQPPTSLTVVAYSDDIELPSTTTTTASEDSQQVSLLSGHLLLA